MKSNINREGTEAKKKYVFFSDPDVIVRRAESTAAASQALQNLQILERQQRRGEPKVNQSEPERSVNTETKSDLKGFETLLSYHPVQPYPFTFITAVKRKLALGMHGEACKRVYEPETVKTQIDTEVNKMSGDMKCSVNQAGQKMDFIKPLKVPDLKISPKTLDYSVQQAASLGGKKFDVHTLEENIPLTSNKSPKGGEKPHRKLDFSSLEGSSIRNCENIEPLKVPDLSIGSTLSKKKEHARDSSREKENRSKRIKKDDSGLTRKDETIKETPRRFKSSKHVSRKEVDEESDSILELFKPENFLSSAPRESDFGLRKPKTKNFLTSTVKKSDDKRHRSADMQSVRSAWERLSETKNQNYDNEPSLDKSTKIHERITTRDNNRGRGNDNFEHTQKMSNQSFNTLRQCDDHKYKNIESSNWKQQKHCTKSMPPPKQLENYSKVQVRQPHEKQKLPSHSEADENDSNTESNILEEIKTASGSVTSSKSVGNPCRIDANNKTDDSMRIEGSAQQSKSNEASHETDRSGRNSQSSGPSEKFRENVGDIGRVENLSSQANNSNSKIIEGSASQADNESNSGSSQNKSNTDYKTSQSKSFSGIIIDPTRISFRDESSKEQNEFCDLVTPEINLLPQSKRRKNFVQEMDNGTDSPSPKHKPASNIQTKDDGGIQLLHPTALHMQFQAELHLLDSFNESLRQVMDVENCLCSTKHEQEQELLLKQKDNEIKRKNLMLTQQIGRDTVDIERHQVNQSKSVPETNKKNNLAPCHVNEDVGANINTMNTAKENPSSESTHKVLDLVQQPQDVVGEPDNVTKKNYNNFVRVTEVQTQTANDIATQTETPRARRRHNSLGRQIPGITYERGSPVIDEIPQLSLESFNQLDDFDQIENVSLPSKMHTMSEISLHETTSSIRTETGTEISISTRDVTCSFNKYLDSELAQLIKDEKQRYDEIEMLFKSREKTLNDRTKKLVKLEEQKRALRDMGQDSRISSVKKKQRALLLKLQQEKDEMNRLKELHKKASQERKLMLQKQRNMLNPQMSTKNILTKLKRSADSQSPRRLSGPMKGYDIRSPSSMSSLVDSDKSQVDRSHLEMKAQILDVKSHKSEGRTPRCDIITPIQEGHDMKYLKCDQFDILTEQSDASLIEFNKLSPDSQKFIAKQHKIQNATQKFNVKSKYEAKTCKYKEVMPKMDISHHKLPGADIEPNICDKKFVEQDAATVTERLKSKDTQQKPILKLFDKSVCEYSRSEFDTLVEEYSKKSKSSQATEIDFQHLKSKKEKESLVQKNFLGSENLNTESNSIPEELSSKKSRTSQLMEEMSEMTTRSSKKNQNTSTTSKDNSKKSQINPRTKSNSKRKGSRSLKPKTPSDVLTENILRSKSGSQISEEIIKHHGKRSKLEKDFDQSEDNYRDSLVDEFDPNESLSSLHALVEHSRAVKEKNYQLLGNVSNEDDAKETVSRKDLENLRNVSRRQEEGHLQNMGNMSTRSQVSTLTISHHSSGESEKSYSRSVVIRAQDHHFRTTKKLEQILSAREAALASRRSCVEEWIAWHSRLRAEENRVARMEEAAFKLVSAASNALSYHDTTVSSDTSDVESRIEILAKKLAERRTEMTRLKREAKRQAKQRLKALETNLLNQIKKYDTTIYEMREKLENKRGALLNNGSSEKLAIESKSLTDFIIPEIPIKRIKEIYKKSDLLKSRSESELRNLMSEHNQRKDVDTIYRDENSEPDNASYRTSPRSVASDVTDRSEISKNNKKLTTPNEQSILQDVKSTVSKIPADFLSESISQQIKSTSYTSHARSSSDKSEDEISTIDLKSKSDPDNNGSEDSRLNESDSEISSRCENQYASSERNTLISQSNVLSKKSIEPVGLAVSLSRESESISENIPRLNSSQELENESIETVPEVKLSRISDTSVQESVSKYISSEVHSEFEERDYESIAKYGSSIRAVIDRASGNSSVPEKSAGDEDEEISITESHELSSPRKVLSRIEISPLEMRLANESSDQSEKNRELKSRSSFNSESDAPKTSMDDDASAKEVSSTVDEIDIDKFVPKSESISNKLSSLELGNKNLNDDISTLENDLKVLSEMMSQFSKRSDGESKRDIIFEKENRSINRALDDSEKATSEDISDSDGPTDYDDRELPLIANNNATYILDEAQANSEVNEKDLTAQVSEIMFKITPESTTLSQNLNEEIDFKARSREILNEIERSIISEHVKSPEIPDDNVKMIDTSVFCLEKKNEEVIDELNSLENDIISIAEMISNASEAKKDIRMIRRLGHDGLFDDGHAVEELPTTHETGCQESEITPLPHGTDSIIVPASNFPDDSDDNENSPRSSNEFEQSVHTAIVHSEHSNSQNFNKNSFGALTVNLERPGTTFETIKDPEYEDISEESLEVSEIMDRSESQRSNRQAYQKSGRLPEKYQMTQKSEDVLRILDEITQKSNEAMQRSQQFSFTPNNNARKIDELFQRSEKLSQNVQSLTKKPNQLDAEFNLSINTSQNSGEKIFPRSEIPSKRPDQSVSACVTVQITNKIDQTRDLPQEFDQRKLDNISRELQIPALSDSSNKSDGLTDVDLEKQSSNFVAKSTKFRSEQNRDQIQEREDDNSAVLSSLVKTLGEASEKSDTTLQRTVIQRPNVTTEFVEESEIVREKIADAYRPNETSQTYDDRCRFQDKEVQDKSSKLNTEISEIAPPVSDDNSSRAKPQDSLTNEESAERVQEDFEDKTSQKFDDSSEKSEGREKNSQRIAYKDGTEISTETYETINSTRLSEDQKYDEVSTKNCGESKANEDPIIDKILAKSEEDLKKLDTRSFDVDVAIHEPENISASQCSGKSVVEQFTKMLDASVPDLQRRKIVDIDDIGQDDSQKNVEFVGLSIQAIENDLEQTEAMQGTGESSRELDDLLEKREEELLLKTTIVEKSDSASQKSDESQGSEKSDDILQKYEVELPSESSEEVDTPRSLSEIEMDSPRDPNDSRLDIEGLDDDLLGNDNNSGTQNASLRGKFHATPAAATSEKDIEAMIDKLKVSLEQPGLDVAELEAKLLRIQQLQIELEIKKLEAEEVSYYVREIPNKPPPPYTPPSGGRLSVSQTSPSPAPAVVPTNVEDLNSFTERATHLIYQAKTSGDDITALEPPIEICELSQDSNDTAKKDRKIYNTFLFDLCKETISEVYQSEYEKPGPSWLKPNAKTKPTMKIPKTVEGLNDYVSKEVATLFGFKTKLQRENLVMRWSRKRRDRVDELLAREAQAEEDEWTKFHHDELAVKNELTTAILDSLLLDAANVVKMAYIKKRKVTS